MKDGSNKQVKRERGLKRLFNLLRVLEKMLIRTFLPYERHGNLSRYNEGGLIIIGNHYAVLDVCFPLYVTDKPIHFMAKSQLFKRGFMKWFTKKCQCVEAKRDGSDVQAIKDSMRILKNEGVIALFPEGTRNRSYGELLPFHSGAAALSIKTKTPIVPIAKITKLKFLRKTHVIYGDPIEFRQYYGKKVSKEELDECDNVLREAISNMRLAFIEKHKLKIKGLNC